MENLTADEALAISLHYNPGVYAVLIGSGLSRSAGIPTGWEITLDLIRQIGAASGTDSHSDWEKWYAKKFGRPVNYSEVLDAVAKTASERRSILHRYIEPQDSQEDRGPTPAHRCIAKLVERGIIRVIITTNFDRLIENALREVGVEPTIIASEDSLAGATPLVHAKCTIIKLHGDYLDARIKNTTDELDTYGAGIDEILDEIFDIFGLIVAGWSGEWDTALRRAILRAPNRRYQLYWASRGKPTQRAEDLINHRDGKLITIDSADGFFTSLIRKLDALEQSSRRHPVGVRSSIELAKIYCRDNKYALEWSEFLADLVKPIQDFIESDAYPSSGVEHQNLHELIMQFMGKSETIRKVAMLTARWGTPEATLALTKVIRSLSFRHKSKGGYTWLLELRSFTASVCLYWSVAGALAHNDYERVRVLLHSKIKTGGMEITAIEALPFTSLLSRDWKFLEGLSNKIDPASEFIYQFFEKEVQEISVDADDAEELFYRLEFIITMEFAHWRQFRLSQGMGTHFWVPRGRYLFSGLGEEVMRRAQPYLTMEDHDPILLAGLVGGKATSAKETAERVVKFDREHPRS